MAVTEKNKVDGIGRSKDGSKVILMISDHLNWDEEYKHLLILQDKVNSYVSFIENGQAQKMYPGVKEYCILIYFKYEITTKCKEFLRVINEQLKENKIQIEFDAENL